jgi:type II secretory pathway pseudopilin PulG
MSIKLKPLQKKGFTVVETFIVIAITGVLFVSTSILIRGQTEKYRYQSEMRQLAQMYQSAMSDTTNGNFESVNGESTSEYILGRGLLFCQNGSLNTQCSGHNSGSDYQKYILTSNASNSIKQPVWTSMSGGLVFTKTMAVDQFGNFSQWPFDSFAPVARFNDITTADNYNGKSDISPQSVSLYDNIGNEKMSEKVMPSSTNKVKQFVLCFSGKQNGSIVINTNSTAIESNLSDTRCN